MHQSAACRVDPEDSPPIFINIRLSRIAALLAVAMVRKNQHKPRRQSRKLKRLDALTRSPIFAWFSDSRVTAFVNKNPVPTKLVDQNYRGYTLSQSSRARGLESIKCVRADIEYLLILMDDIRKMLFT